MRMKDDDGDAPFPTPAARRNDDGDAPPPPPPPLIGRSGAARYKLWALAAILLLALWSMLAGSVSLNWSAGGNHLNRLSRDFFFLDRTTGRLDLDSLEMEEREKVVRDMWEVYTQGRRRVRLPRFWQKAFEAAYEDLAGDDRDAMDAAVSEIARMSVRMLDLDPPAATSTGEVAGAVDGKGGGGLELPASS